jgi:type II secretion system protein G
MLVTPVLFLAGCFHPIRRSDALRAEMARAQVATLKDALFRYKADTGEFPTPVAGPDPLRRRPLRISNWHGPYLSEEIPLDPWGHVYVYSVDHNGSPWVASYGADGQPGGEACDANITTADVAASENATIQNTDTIPNNCK